MTASRRRKSSGPSAPWLIGGILASIFVYWWWTTGTLWRSSHWDHYYYLAEAFLNGSLSLTSPPNDPGDMAVIDGRLYVVFGPFPALLMMPFAPIFGRETPDILVLVGTALAGVWAFYRLLVTVHGAADPWRLSLATLTFALGTAIHYGAPMGNVWLHAQITATTLQVFALLAAASGRVLATGILLGLTVLTRPTTTLAAPFCAWLLWSRRHDSEAGPHPDVRAALRFLGPLVAAILIHAAYNWARFGSVADAGYRYILMGEEFQRRVAEYGRFSSHYLVENLQGWAFRGPVFDGSHWQPDPHGMSLMLTTPYLLLMAWPRKWSRFEILACLSFVVCVAPSWLYYNDGWVHFGQRFALDGIGLALLVASYGAARAPLGLVAFLTVWGIGVGAWGLRWFQSHFLH